MIMDASIPILQTALPKILTKLLSSAVWIFITQQIKKISERQSCVMASLINWERFLKIKRYTVHLDS